MSSSTGSRCSFFKEQVQRAPCWQQHVCGSNGFCQSTMKVAEGHSHTYLAIALLMWTVFFRMSLVMTLAFDVLRASLAQPSAMVTL